ncbi:calphotin-like [Zingiber officinale]|uniref:calphotin-like n=1 Tax=Zingiber officinale TaxID=94328 RepID=UPI001C4C8014|nr:calphotin-like [Zingiber officinale]
MTHTRISVPRRGRLRRRPIDSPETESPKSSARVEPVRQGQTPQGIRSTSGPQILTVPISEVLTSIVPAVVPPSAYPTPSPSTVPTAYPVPPLVVPVIAYSVPQAPALISTYSALVPAVSVAPYPVPSTVPSVAPTYVYSVVPPAVPPIGSALVVLPSSTTIPMDIVAA